MAEIDMLHAEIEEVLRLGRDDPLPVQALERLFTKIASRVEPDPSLQPALVERWMTAARGVRCEAVIFHGPGHQSRSHCELRGRHTVHQNIETGRLLQWEGDEGMTGFFDESPYYD